MKKFFTKIMAFSIFFLANPVFAQDEPPTLSGNIGPIVDKITGYLFPVAVLISLVFGNSFSNLWNIKNSY